MNSPQNCTLPHQWLHQIQISKTGQQSPPLALLVRSLASPMALPAGWLLPTRFTLSLRLPIIQLLHLLIKHHYNPDISFSFFQIHQRFIISKLLRMLDLRSVQLENKLNSLFGVKRQFLSVMLWEAECGSNVEGRTWLQLINRTVDINLIKRIKKAIQNSYESPRYSGEERGSC